MIFMMSFQKQCSQTSFFWFLHDFTFEHLKQILKKQKLTEQARLSRVWIYSLLLVAKTKRSYGHFFFFSPIKILAKQARLSHVWIYSMPRPVLMLCFVFFFFIYGNTMSYYDHECCTLYYQSQFIMVSKKKKKITIYNIFPPCKNTQKF